MKDKSTRNDDRALIRVIQFSSAFGLGTMAAILYSVKQVSPVLRYEISFGTGVAFVLAIGLSWAFWRLVFGKEPELDGSLSRRRRRWFAVLALILTGATLAPFVYALKDVTNDEARQVAQGTAWALLALSALGFLFWRVIRFLNADSQRNADGDHSSSKPE
jgi:hypothetical protein